MDKEQKSAEEIRKLLDESDRMRGLGDAVSRVTKKLGIRECGGCQRRREWLNKRVPFRRAK